MGNVFRDVILRYANSRKFASAPTDWVAAYKEENTLCGDLVHVYFEQPDKANQNLVLHYVAEGCSLCKASAAILAEVMTGKSKALWESHVVTFINAYPKNDMSEISDPDVGALFDMHRFPTRERCVLLPWQAVHQCLKNLTL